MTNTTTKEYYPKYMRNLQDHLGINLDLESDRSVPFQSLVRNSAKSLSKEDAEPLTAEMVWAQVSDYLYAVSDRPRCSPVPALCNGQMKYVPVTVIAGVTDILKSGFSPKPRVKVSVKLYEPRDAPTVRRIARNSNRGYHQVRSILAGVDKVSRLHYLTEAESLHDRELAASLARLQDRSYRELVAKAVYHLHEADDSDFELGDAIDAVVSYRGTAADRALVTAWVE